MLQACKGAYPWLGQGKTSAPGEANVPLHHPQYDFNDAVMPIGIRLLTTLVEQQLAV